MVNLENITFTELNITGILPSDPTDVIAKVNSTAVENTNGYLGISIMLVIFIFMTYLLFREDDLFRLDLTRSLLLSSLFTFIIGVVLLSIDIITSFRHIVWFGIIFLVSVFGVYYKKRKGL